MKVLLTGSTGQLGRELAELMPGNVELVRGYRGAAPADDGGFGAVQFDMAQPDRLESILDELKPTVILNAGAYTAVDRAEEQQDLAQAVNATAPGVLARWAGKNAAKLLHFSTDYVFDGKQNAPYQEADQTNPLSVYGQTKLAGEQAVGAAGCEHLIMRTSWVYANHGHNFVLTMLRLAQEGKSLKVVNDQFGRPTWARNLASYALRALGTPNVLRVQKTPNVLHVADQGVSSWFEFAQDVFKVALAQGLLKKMPELAPVGSDQYAQAAPRPARSILDTRAMEENLAMKPVDRTDALTACLKELEHS